MGYTHKPVYYSRMFVALDGVPTTNVESLLKERMAEDVN